MTERRAAALAVMMTLFTPVTALADEEEIHRPPMPEPIFTETVTDIDAYERGELEIELNGTHLRALRGGARSLQGSLEVEWLMTRKLGVRVEPFINSSRDGALSASQQTYGSSFGASWKLLQDFQHDFHLQAEVNGRLPWDTSTRIDPGESPLPLAFDLRSGLREGRWTVRGGVGAAAGGTAAHVPLRGALALLTGFAETERYGFWGVEAEVDGSRQSPMVLALNLEPRLTPLGIPVRMALAIPWAVGARETEPSVGIFLRIFFESAREVEYGESGTLK